MATALLTLGSAAWLALLTLFPELRASPWFLAGTVCWLSINGVVSFLILFWKKRLLFLVNVLQILLFALLFCQVFHTLGRHHFQTMGEPILFDWQLFAWAHALRAADLVHLMPAYGIRLQPIEHLSPLAGVLLVLMHVQVTVYVLGLLVRWASKAWARWQGEASPLEKRLWKERLRRGLRWGLGVAWVGVFLAALFEGWAARDWFLWPLENVLRTLDLGGILKVFGWRLHGVEPSTWVGTLGLIFRALVGSVLLSYVQVWQLYWLGARAPRPLEDFIDDLHHPEEKVRAAAACALGTIGQGEAVPPLVLTLDDDSGPVGSASRAALRRVGAAPESSLPKLIGQLRHPNWAIRRGAATALGKMGPNALAAVPALVEKLVDDDHLTEARAEEALRLIYPGWETGSLGRPAIPYLLGKLNHSKRRQRQRAADVLGWFGPGAATAIPALLRALHDSEEYVRLSAEWALDRIDPGWQRRVYAMPSLLSEIGL